MRSLGDGDTPWGLPLPVPGPGAPFVPPGAMPAATPYRLFPTNVIEGDVVQVTGDFRNMMQGQARVRFAGTPWQGIAISSPYGGSIVVPRGAQTGACQIEVNGRTVFGTNCVVTRRTGNYGQRVRAERRDMRAWKNFGPGSQLMGDPMTYGSDGTEYSRGVGAIAALDPGAARPIGTKVLSPNVVIERARPVPPRIRTSAPKTVRGTVRTSGATVRYNAVVNLATGRQVKTTKAVPTKTMRPQLGTGVGQNRPTITTLPAPPLPTTGGTTQTIGGGGGGGAWSPPARPIVSVPEFEDLPDPIPVQPPTSSSRTLVYAALGLGAAYLLLRRK